MPVLIRQYSVHDLSLLRTDRGKRREHPLFHHLHQHVCCGEEAEGWCKNDDRGPDFSSVIEGMTNSRRQRMGKR